MAWGGWWWRWNHGRSVVLLSYTPSLLLPASSLLLAPKFTWPLHAGLAMFSWWRKEHFFRFHDVLPEFLSFFHPGGYLLRLDALMTCISHGAPCAFALERNHSCSVTKQDPLQTFLPLSHIHGYGKDMPCLFHLLSSIPTIYTRRTIDSTPAHRKTVSYCFVLFIFTYIYVFAFRLSYVGL